MNKIKKYIQESVRKYLNENEGMLVDFNSFPPSVLDTLDNEYGSYQDTFDWNQKQDEYSNNVDFQQFLSRNKSVGLIKSLDKLIQQTDEDIQLIQKQNRVSAKLKAFEELIKPTLGNGVLSPALTKFEEMVLMSTTATIKDIERGFREAKELIDKDGNLNNDKVTPSNNFPGGDINLPAFERLIQQQPEFRGVFDDWKRLFDEEMNLTLMELNAYRNSTPIHKIVELRNFLINYKKQLK